MEDFPGLTFINRITAQTITMLLVARTNNQPPAVLFITNLGKPQPQVEAKIRLASFQTPSPANRNPDAQDFYLPGTQERPPLDHISQPSKHGLSVSMRLRKIVTKQKLVWEFVIDFSVSRQGHLHWPAPKWLDKVLEKERLTDLEELPSFRTTKRKEKVARLGVAKVGNEPIRNPKSYDSGIPKLIKFPMEQAQ